MDVLVVSLCLFNNRKINSNGLSVLVCKHRINLILPYGLKNPKGHGLAIQKEKRNGKKNFSLITSLLRWRIMRK